MPLNKYLESEPLEDTATIFAQWQTCVESANKISSRRDTVNSIFITLNLSLITAISYIWSIKTIAIIISGILFCYIWSKLLLYYKQLNTAKYQVIQDLEKKLPVQPFTQEWSLFKSMDSKEGTDLERLIPTSFAFIYVVLCIGLLLVEVA